MHKFYSQFGLELSSGISLQGLMRLNSEVKRMGCPCVVIEESDFPIKLEEIKEFAQINGAEYSCQQGLHGTVFIVERFHLQFPNGRPELVTAYLLPRRLERLNEKYKQDRKTKEPPQG